MLRPTPYQVAVMLIVVTRRAGAKRGSATRWKFSGTTIRKVACRRTLRVPFLDELIYELEELGFILIQLPSGSFGLITLDAVEGWTRLSARDRIADELGILETQGYQAFSGAIDKLAADLESDVSRIMEE